MSAIEPAGAEEVALLAAALRADAGDLATYERVLVGSLSDSLPPGCVEIDRNRSISDRLAGRLGEPRAIRIHLGETTLELAMTKGRLVGTVGRSVRGVAISRREVPLGEWATSFAEA
ncbi:MAG TPA: hypothetical protein VG368_08430, partial [Acidimicrobiales bacterium]|nr:hypothetical protein [Acidimicrobiales bacterium]